MKKNLPLILVGVGAVALFFFMKNKKSAELKSSGTIVPTPPPPEAKKKNKAGMFVKSLLSSAKDIYASTQQSKDK